MFLPESFPSRNVSSTYRARHVLCNINKCVKRRRRLSIDLIQLNRRQKCS